MSHIPDHLKEGAEFDCDEHMPAVAAAIRAMAADQKAKRAAAQADADEIAALKRRIEALERKP
jgi:polyhydroxyalkanoate synthesis regulator phasin